MSIQAYDAFSKALKYTEQINVRDFRVKLKNWVKLGKLREVIIKYTFKVNFSFR